MKVKIYVNTDDYCVGDMFPRVLTEKQYQEKIEELVKDRMENLKHDDGFEEHLAEDYHINEVFCMTEEKRKQIIEDFKPYAVDSAKDEMKDYYEEYEIEI
jgi:hypothetical protein